jgi:hypothetical protein
MVGRTEVRVVGTGQNNEPAGNNAQRPMCKVLILVRGSTDTPPGRLRVR